MAFSQRARAYTLNPTLPCPTLPLSPRALSDSSKSQQRAGFALNYKAALHAITYMLRARHDTPGSGVPSASEIASLQAIYSERNCFLATDTMFALPERYARTMHWTRPGALLSVAS